MVETVKVAVDLPDGIVTVAGTVALDEALTSVTITPEGPAGPVNVIVPVELAPPWTEVGFSANKLKLAGVIVRV